MNDFNLLFLESVCFQNMSFRNISRVFSSAHFLSVSSSVCSLTLPASSSSITRNWGSMPASIAFSLSNRAQKLWMVERYANSISWRPFSIPFCSNNLAVLIFISFAAFSVNVRVRISLIDTLCSVTRFANRSTSTCVFPEPGPATTQISLSVVSTPFI